MDARWVALSDSFESAYGRRPQAGSDAGGRVNLIGEHTDYHEGYVFPAAIDLRTLAVGAKRNDGMVRVRSMRTAGEASATLATLAPPLAGWQAYVLGPLWALREEGLIASGADILVDSDVPFGGGLSSSASVQVALIGLALALAGEQRGPACSPALTRATMDVARLARKAENGFCGVACGIMDQVASACGRAGHAILLDCRTLDRVEVPIPPDWALVVADSGVKHALGTSEYAKRQAECASGLALLRKDDERRKALRDVTLPMLQPWEGKMPDKAYRRLRHVVTENERVIHARRALESVDSAGFGKLLFASHESLARDYEVSCPELDALVEVASSVPGVIGARLTGAGFGGNTINVVASERAQACAQAIVDGYASRTGRRTRALVVRPSGGLEVQWL